MEFRILGPFEVTEEGRLIFVAGEKQRALLALLLLHANEVVSVDRLVEDLWEGTPTQGARTTLRSHVSRLRKVLDATSGAENDLDVRAEAKATLVMQAPGYMLQLHPEQIDAIRFEHLVAKGHQALIEENFSGASTILRQALVLWRGPPWAEFSSASWAQTEIARLEELHLAALEDRIEADLALGRHSELVGELETLVAHHPLRERLWGHLMLTLYRCNRQAEAIRAYQDLRHHLVEEMGLDPGPLLKRLEQDILRQDPSLDWVPSGVEAPSLIVSSKDSPHNLPVQLTSFIGREIEVAQVNKLLESDRLVTLTGAGGCGKTRLALEVAGRQLEKHPDGVWFVDLASLADADLVPQTVAATLSILDEPGASPLGTLAAHLRLRRLLIVLDNCEHLVAACALLVEHLLRSCQGLKVLATSRELLGIPGEIPRRVSSLSVPDPARVSSLEELMSYESARLFVERARSARPDLSLDHDDLVAVARVCVRLDGIPLVIELAAARVTVLSVHQIAARLDDSLRLLTAGSRTVLPRQQTLRAAIQWGHDLLSPSERALFRRLAAFAGGFTLEAVESTCSDLGGDEQVSHAEILDLLAQLVAKSFVLADSTGSATRYRLLETIRQFAREKLIEAGELVEMRARHRAWCLALAEESEAEAFGARGRAVLDRLEAEHENFRVALEWSIEDPAAGMGLRLVYALYPLWLLRSHCREGRGWIEALAWPLDEDAGTSEMNAMKSAVTCRAAHLAWRVGDLEGASQLCAKALTLARASGRQRQVGQVLKTSAEVAMIRGELDLARSFLEESLAIARATDDQVSMTGALRWLGWVAQRQARYGEARARVEELRAVGGGESWFYEGRALYLLGWIELEQGQYATAQRLFEESLALTTAAGDQEYEVSVLEGLGMVAAAQGRIEEARLAYKRSLMLTRQLRQVLLVGPLAGLGQLASAEGDHTNAQTLLDEGLTRARQLGDVYLIAWTLNRLGQACVARGDGDAARPAYEEALAIATQAGMPWHMAASIEGLAELDVAGGEPTEATRAVTLLSAADSLRKAIGAPLTPSAKDAYDNVLATARAELGEEAFTAAWAEGQPMTPHQAIALATNNRLP